MAAVDHLTPFVKGDERAREAGRRGAATRKARREAERADATTIVANLRTLGEAARGADIGVICIGVAISVLGRVASGAVPVRHASDAAELVKVLVDVARLEAGLSTSNAVVAHLSSADARARLAELRAIAGGVLDAAEPATSATAVAAEDTPVNANDPQGRVVAESAAPEEGGTGDGGESSA